MEKINRSFVNPYIKYFCRDAWHASQILRFVLVVIHETCFQETHSMRLYNSLCLIEKSSFMNPNLK